MFIYDFIKDGKKIIIWTRFVLRFMMLKKGNKMNTDFINTAHKLGEKSQELIERLNLSFPVDNCIKENLLKDIRLSKDIPVGYDLLMKKLKSLNLKDWKKTKNENYFRANWNISSISEKVKNWREEPTEINYNKIPLKEKKEIFDCFFRYDVYGKSERKKNTIHLSRGVNDPNYFFPPAFVKAGLNVAAENDWFGYSDSLGHRDTRGKIAQLEQIRRNQKKCSAENTAVVQGGTEGLNSLLSFISKLGDRRKKCMVISPTYAPIIDVIGYYFKPEIYFLNRDYSFSMENIINGIDEKTAVVLFSIPHNPGGFSDIKKFLPVLQEKCARFGTYFIADEIMFDEKISPYLDPIKYKNLIVLASYSKMYNIAGLKLGHILADTRFIDKFYRHASTTYGSPPSFLYYTVSLTAFYEKAFLEKRKAAVPPELKGKISDKSLLLQEFKIWRELIDLHMKFQNFVILSMIRKFNLEKYFDIFGLHDVSPNIIIRLKNSRQTAYELFLRILNDCNVSVIPIECFVPPSHWPSDLRVTSAVKPCVLVEAFYDVLRCILRTNDIEWQGKRGEYDGKI